MQARLYRPARNAMQSGQAKTHDWVLEFEPARGAVVEPLMGYTSSTDTQRQVRLTFASREEAVAYCTRSGIAYRVMEPKDKSVKRMSYSDNFRFNRQESWTH